jgi:hypothetical protein
MRIVGEIMVVATAVAAMSSTAGGQRESDAALARVDHLVYATPDLDLGVTTIEGLLGVRASAGGRHPGLATRNALIALGPTPIWKSSRPIPSSPALRRGAGSASTT